MNTDKKIEEVLSSLDGMQRAEPNPFFYTRVMARLQRQEENVWGKAVSFISRPAVISLGFCFVLVINAFSFISGNKQSYEETAMKETSPSTYYTENEFIIASGTSFQYANIDGQ